MTALIGDFSNHDWDRGGMDFAAMRRAGLLGAIHKCTDGMNFYRDPYWPVAAGRMRAAFGDGVYGAYHVLWGNRSIPGQVDWWFAVLDATAPGWRTDPGFALMSDNEPFGYNAPPSIGQINQAGDYIRQLTGKVMLAYAPTWVYGAAVNVLRYPLVASNYGANPPGKFTTGYPGDASARWRPPTAVLLQYGSRLSIGPQSGCDVNAYRGTITDLRARLTPAPVAPTEVTTEDDMPTGIPSTRITEPRPGATASHCIWPVNSGGLPWGPAWLTIWGDLAGAQAKVRMVTSDGAGHDTAWIRGDGGGLVPDPTGAGGIVIDSGRLVNLQLPDGTRGVSFQRQPLSDADACDTVLSFSVEYGRRP